MLIRREAVGKRAQETRREAAAGTVARAERAGMEKAITERVPAQRMPTARATVFLYADDPISQAGVASQLRPRPEVQLVDPGELDRADVAVVVTESVDESVLRVLRAVRRGNVPRTVLIAAALDDAAVVAAAEAGVSALLRRSEVTPDRLVSVILKARDGGAEMPADLLAGLLGQVGRLQRQVLTPRGLRFSGLSDREVEVLRLVADGLDTGEIAQRLAFSERTIKSVLHDVTTRLQLRNRAHAVAFAVREGFI
jgi:DNA-binding NarL/FixJ family response regulator